MFVGKRGGDMAEKGRGEGDFFEVDNLGTVVFRHG